MCESGETDLHAVVRMKGYLSNLLCKSVNVVRKLYILISRRLHSRIHLGVSLQSRTENEMGVFNETSISKLEC